MGTYGRVDELFSDHHFGRSDSLLRGEMDRMSNIIVEAMSKEFNGSVKAKAGDAL